MKQKLFGVAGDGDEVAQLLRERYPESLTFDFRSLPLETVKQIRATEDYWYDFKHIIFTGISTAEHADFVIGARGNVIYVSGGEEPLLPHSMVLYKTADAATFRDSFLKLPFLTA